jgi:putative addiction module component (TIGR02574 family)
MSQPLQIEKLSTDERLRLIEQLWESLRTTPEAIPLTDAQKAELDRRLDELEKGDVEGIPWNEVLRRIKNRPS